MNLNDYIGLHAARKLDGRTTFQGLDISIENKVGSVRRGVSDNGKPWATKMRFAYGYIRMSKGVDGDQVDCFVGPIKNAKNAYVVHVKDKRNGKYDEDKVMLGFDSAKTAKRVFLQHYDDPGFFGSMDTVPMASFIQKVKATRTAPKMITAMARAIELYMWAEANRTVCVDFDNTLARYTGWKGSNHTGSALPAGLQLLKLLQKSGLTPVVLTARGKESHGAVKKWLAKNGFPNIKVTNTKVPALAYIDDKAHSWPQDPAKLVKKILKTIKQNGVQAFNESLQPYRLAYLDPFPTSHPPSLKNPQHVPTDSPRETDDRFLDVTKRKDKAGQKYRNELSRRNNIPPSLPAVTTRPTYPIG